MKRSVLIVVFLELFASLALSWPLLLDKPDVYIYRVSKDMWLFETAGDIGYLGFPACYPQGKANIGSFTSCERKLEVDELANFTRSFIMFDKPFYVVINQYKKDSKKAEEMAQNHRFFGECPIDVYTIEDTVEYCVKRKFKDYENEDGS